MDANSVTAICAVIIAAVSLVVSVREARSNREHNRNSVLPALELWRHHREGGTTGISLSNHGTGPALITHSSVWLDGVHLGAWEKEPVLIVRDAVRGRPRMSTMTSQMWTLPAGESRFLLYTENYDDASNSDFYHLVRYRIAIEFNYESLYRGENFKVFYDPNGTLTRSSIDPS